MPELPFGDGVCVVCVPSITVVLRSSLPASGEGDARVLGEASQPGQWQSQRVPLGVLRDSAIALAGESPLKTEVSPPCACASISPRGYRGSQASQQRDRVFLPEHPLPAARPGILQAAVAEAIFHY